MCNGFFDVNSCLILAVIRGLTFVILPKKQNFAIKRTYLRFNLAQLNTRSYIPLAEDEFRKMLFKSPPTEAKRKIHAKQAC